MHRCVTPPSAKTSRPAPPGTSTSAPACRRSRRDGNAATTAEAWLSPLTPGGRQRPVKPTRDYTDAFTDAWNNSKCDPTSCTRAATTSTPSVTNLFVAHNRMHDFSYFLGFTEANCNLQIDNFGNGDPTAANDPEIGNVQAGAITGGAPRTWVATTPTRSPCRTASPASPTSTCSSRSPARSTRPARTATSTSRLRPRVHPRDHQPHGRRPRRGPRLRQAGSMGESWSDQVALEYLFEHSYSTGAQPVGRRSYVTGNKTPASATTRSTPTRCSTATPVRRHRPRGARRRRGLERRDVDGAPGAGHASTTRTLPRTDKALQLRCAKAQSPARRRRPTQCPATALDPADLRLVPAPGGRDEHARRPRRLLAADKMRFGGANQAASGRGSRRAAWVRKASTQDIDTRTTSPSRITPRRSPTGHRELHGGARPRESGSQPRGQALRRLLPGPRHPDRRHRRPPRR